jgi:hypothetical protein
MRIDIPTCLNAAETDLVRAVCAGKRVYEAGALLGYSRSPAT